MSIFLKENNLSTNALKYTEIPDRLKLITENRFQYLFILDAIKQKKLLNTDILYLHYILYQCCNNIIKFLMYIVMI